MVLAAGGGRPAPRDVPIRRLPSTSVLKESRCWDLSTLYLFILAQILACGSTLFFCVLYLNATSIIFKAHWNTGRTEWWG